MSVFELLAPQKNWTNLNVQSVGTTNLYGINNFSIIGVTGGVSPQQIVGGTLLFNVNAVGVFLPTKTQLDTYFNNQRNISFKIFLHTLPGVNILITAGSGTTFANGGSSSGMSPNQQKFITMTCDSNGTWLIWYSSLA